MEKDIKTLAGIMAAAKELNTAAKNVGLEFWFDLDFHFEWFRMSITKGIGPGCTDIWYGASTMRMTEELISQKMDEAAEVLAKYKEDQESVLEKEVADLAEQLKSKKAALRKVKKGGAK